MSSLYLIRHGQASFGAADYDVLSDKGARQAHALGRHWAEVGHQIDAVYRGPRRRHIDSERHFQAGARERGGSYPEASELTGLDEYPAIELLKHWMPILSAEDPAFRALLSPDSGPGDRPRWGRAFNFIMEAWARGDLSTGDLQTFADFQGQVRTALQDIMKQQGRGRRVAVFTSGGVICMALQWALALHDDVAIRQGWVIGNGSVTEFRYREADAITLIRFNIMGHLRAPGLITYR